MRRTTAAGLLAALTLTLTACGTTGDGITPPESKGSALLQVTLEGGFVPVEFSLGRGPKFTLVDDGRLIYEGPVIAIFPAPLLPNYQVTTLTADQVQRVLDVVDTMGLPNMVDEYDDTNTRTVADAPTEVVTYWDDNGAHRYSVYALGLVDGPARPATAAFEGLLDLLGSLTAGSSVPYRGEQAQIVAGVGLANPEFPDTRDWPLPNQDLRGWKTLPNGWMCQTMGSEVLDVFADATSVTRWANPDPSLDAETLTLLARPLHPGEEPCFGAD